MIVNLSDTKTRKENKEEKREYKKTSQEGFADIVKRVEPALGKKIKIKRIVKQDNGEESKKITVITDHKYNQEEDKESEQISKQDEKTQEEANIDNGKIQKNEINQKEKSKKKREKSNEGDFGKKNSDVNRKENNNQKSEKNKVSDTEIFTESHKRVENLNCGCVYKITNLINGKIYIGQTKQSLERRWTGHLKRVREGRKTILCKAINKYGANNFKIEEIEKCNTKVELDKKEKSYIKKFKSNAIEHSNPSYGYNMTPGGDWHPTFYGSDHPQYKKIDQDYLIELLSKGYSTIEICQELGIGNTALKNKIKEIDTNFNNIIVAREKFGGTELFKNRRKKKLSESHKGYTMSEEKKQYRSNLYSGKGNPNYKVINNDIVINLMKQGLKAEDIYNEIGISKNTFYKKLKELTINYLGKELSFPKARDHFYWKLILRELISKGFNREEIAKKANCSLYHVSKKLNSLWKMDFYQAKRIFRGYTVINKVLLEDLIRMGSSPDDIDNVFLRKLIPKYSTSELENMLYNEIDTIYRVLNKLWGYKNLTEAREGFVDSKLSDTERKKLINDAAQQREKERRKKISESKTIKISKIQLKELLYKGLNKEELIKTLKISEGTFKKKMKHILNMNFPNARVQFYWKPRLEELILKGFSKEQFAMELKTTVRSIEHRFIGLWGTQNLTKLKNLLRKNN